MLSIIVANHEIIYQYINLFYGNKYKKSGIFVLDGSTLLYNLDENKDIEYLEIFRYKADNFISTIQYIDHFPDLKMLFIPDIKKGKWLLENLDNLYYLELPIIPEYLEDTLSTNGKYIYKIRPYIINYLLSIENNKIITNSKVKEILYPKINNKIFVITESDLLIFKREPQFKLDNFLLKTLNNHSPHFYKNHK